MDKKNLLAGKRIAVIGGSGNVGSLLAKKLAQVEGIGGVVATGRDAQKLHTLSQEGIETSTDNVQAVQEADIVLLCVKPQQMKGVVAQIGAHAQGKIVVSVAAGVPLEYLERELAGAAVVRCMPNLCASIGMSQTAVATNSKNGEGAIARAMLSLLGKTYEVEEKQVAVWTSVCASGPAFLVRAAVRNIRDEHMLPCMEDALCREGFGKSEAAQIARDVLSSTKRLMEEREWGAAEFVKKVASRKGTTRAGLKAWGRKFDEEGLSSAFEAAKLRAQEIERGFA
ncbi:Pyrroline-5-carboxylate reductase [Candidatus Anstonella stagnisolia]|nr:Pyrroline-5-carboxylate reductase [Candidatus Anstonella stagnisolia]